MKKNVLIVICVLLVIASIFVITKFGFTKKESSRKYEDGIEELDPNTIKLEGSKVIVHFSEVILSAPHETRKLVVMEKDATVGTTIENEKLFGLGVFEKTQRVTYTAQGSFVVELDTLKEEDIITDYDNKVITIRIPHPKLDTIEIDPHKIIVGEQKKGLLAFGGLKMTVNDYVLLEKELQRRLKVSLETSANGQEADDFALRMVKEVYEPVIHAVDSDYTVVVEFRDNVG